MYISKLKFYLIWGTVGLIFFAMEYLLFSHFSSLDSLSYGISIVLTFIGWFVFRDIAINGFKQGKDVDLHFDAIIDYNLSKKYTAITEHHTHVDLEVFKFQALDRKHRSLSFTTLGVRPKIFVHERFFELLNDKEREALILHEIHHFIRRDVFKSYVLGTAVLIFTGISLLVLVKLFLSGWQFLNIVFAIVAVSGLVLATLFLKIHLWFRETSADIFAAKTMGTNIYMISVLEKAYEMMRQFHYHKERNKWQSMYQRRKTILERGTHLNS